MEFLKICKNMNNLLNIFKNALNSKFRRNDTQRITPSLKQCKCFKMYYVRPEFKKSWKSKTSSGLKPRQDLICCFISCSEYVRYFFIYINLRLSAFFLFHADILFLLSSLYVSKLDHLKKTLALGDVSDVRSQSHHWFPRTPGERLSFLSSLSVTAPGLRSRCSLQPPDPWPSPHEQISHLFHHHRKGKYLRRWL